MHTSIDEEILAGLHSGEVVPYLGPGALHGVTEVGTGEPMPIEDDALILAMNNGRPMSPRLMYEFSRAAMSVEHRRGRSALERFLNHTYRDRSWTPSPLHQELAAMHLPYVVDTNRDTQLQLAYADRPHLLVTGTARVMEKGARYRVFQYDGSEYRELPAAEAEWSLPILFKPLGTPLPSPGYIASDADYVDYITELMGGFAIPPHPKGYRQQRKYLLLGLRFTRDTQRMIYSEISYGAASAAGWAVIPEPTEKERRFCAKKGIAVLEYAAAAAPV